MNNSTTTAVPGSNCQWCGSIHGVKCPLVKAIEYEHGMVKRVEFFAPNDYAPKLAGWDPNVFPPALSYAQPRFPLATCGGSGADQGSARLT
jgi:hypothetical protein